MKTKEGVCLLQDYHITHKTLHIKRYKTKRTHDPNSANSCSCPVVVVAVELIVAVVGRFTDANTYIWK